MLALVTKGGPMSRKDRILSEAQLAANRANAQHSTGPRTPEGKLISAQNGPRHKTNIDNFIDIAVLPGECFNAFNATLQRYIAVYRPSDSVELDIVNQMAVNVSQLERYQSHVFANTRSLAYSPDTKGTPEERAAQSVAATILHPQIKEYNRLIAACQRLRGRLIADLAKHRNEIEKAPTRALPTPAVVQPTNLPEPEIRGWEDYESNKDHPDLARTHNYGIDTKFFKQSNPTATFNISQLIKKQPLDPTKKAA